MPGVVDHQERAGAVGLGVHGLAVELSVLRVDLPGENRLPFELLGLVPEYEHDLPTDVDSDLNQVSTSLLPDLCGGISHDSVTRLLYG